MRLQAQAAIPLSTGCLALMGYFILPRSGLQFGEDIRPFDSAPYWRIWENMQSLIERGIDPLTLPY